MRYTGMGHEGKERVVSELACKQMVCLRQT